MKKMIAALIVMMACSSAFALTEKDSWNTILADNHYVVAAPYSMFGATGVLNACATATEIRSVAPVKTCVETKWVDGSGEAGMPHTECVREEARSVAIARSGMTSVCKTYAPINEISSGECLAWENRPYEISLTQSVDVLFAGGEQYGALAFVKNFTIPNCQ